MRVEGFHDLDGRSAEKSEACRGHTVQGSFGFGLSAMLQGRGGVGGGGMSEA